jgi:hypothetical protein
MSCNLSLGRQEVCKESVGGLQGVFFLNYPSASADPNFTYDKTTGEVTSFPSGSIVYYYQLKGNSAYTETVNSSRDNGTTFFSQALTLNLKKLTPEMTTQLKLMAWGRPVAIVWTTNGEALVAGMTKGTDLTGGTISTGAGLGDMFGYSITMTGLEPLPAQFISGSSSTNPFGKVGNSPTVVSGSAAAVNL